MGMEFSEENIQTLFSQEEIEAQVSKLAEEIKKDYEDLNNLVVIAVLKGAMLFSSDLIKKFGAGPELEFIRLSSYNGGMESSGTVKSYDLSLPDISGKDVLITEDIVDSGRTADFLLRFLKDQANAKSIKIASLLDKPSKRLEEFENIKPDYCCFTVEDKFIVGYGLDYDQKFRNLPYLGHIEC